VTKALSIDTMHCRFPDRLETICYYDDNNLTAYHYTF